MDRAIVWQTVPQIKSGESRKPRCGPWRIRTGSVYEFGHVKTVTSLACLSGDTKFIGGTHHCFRSNTPVCRLKTHRCRNVWKAESDDISVMEVPWLFWSTSGLLLLDTLLWYVTKCVDKFGKHKSIAGGCDTHFINSSEQKRRWHRKYPLLTPMEHNYFVSGGFVWLVAKCSNQFSVLASKCQILRSNVRHPPHFTWKFHRHGVTNDSKSATPRM